MAERVRHRGESSSVPVGVYWGRFNPPHLGHLSVIQRFRGRMSLVVAIGSSERRNERENPFSGAERREMMAALLRGSGIRNVRVVTLRDGPSESWAVDNLIRKCQPDLLLLSTEKRGLSDVAQGRVPVVRFRRRGSISSTRIRDAIAGGVTGWKRLTGASVAKWIERHGGVGRIRRAYARAKMPAPRLGVPPGRA